MHISVAEMKITPQERFNWSRSWAIAVLEPRFSGVFSSVCFQSQNLLNYVPKSLMTVFFHIPHRTECFGPQFGRKVCLLRAQKVRRLASLSGNCGQFQGKRQIQTQRQVYHHVQEGTQ